MGARWAYQALGYNYNSSSTIPPACGLLAALGNSTSDTYSTTTPTS